LLYSFSTIARLAQLTLTYHALPHTFHRLGHLRLVKHGASLLPRRPPHHCSGRLPAALSGSMASASLSGPQTLRLQTCPVLDYLHRAIVAHRAGLPDPQLLGHAGD
jgi:hypothetical protein